MATSYPVKFAKKIFNSASDARSYSSSNQNTIIFDEGHSTIYLNGNPYRCDVQDVTFANSKLVITKTDGSKIELDFSDIASASSTMAVFNQLKSVIGLDTGQETGTQGFFTNTAYAQGAQSTVQGIKQLDSAIKGVQGAVQGVDKSLNDYKTQVDTKLTAIQGALGVNNDFVYHPNSEGTYIQNANNVTEAINALDTAVKDAGAVTVEEQTTPTAGYLKTYVIKQNNVEKGTIDIPKDFLVKSATSGTVTAADKESGGKFADDSTYAVGDVYLDLVINTKEDDGTNEHIYVNLKSLIDTYIGDTSNTLDYTATTFTTRAGKATVNIDKTNNRISVTVDDNAITTIKLADQAVTAAKINNAVFTEGQSAVQTNGPAVTLGTFNTAQGARPISVQVGLYWDEWDEPNNA